jgi:hypothetical protein
VAEIVLGLASRLQAGGFRQLGDAVGSGAAEWRNKTE